MSTFRAGRGGGFTYLTLAALFRRWEGGLPAPAQVGLEEAEEESTTVELLMGWACGTVELLRR